MAAPFLGELITDVRQELLAFGNTTLVTDGDTLDPSASTDPKIRITGQLNRALIEFAKDTKYLQDEIPIDIADGTREYAITSNVFDVEMVFHAGRRLLLTNTFDLADQYPLWRNAPVGYPTMYYMRGMDKIALVNTPSSDAVTLDPVITLMVSLAPDLMAVANADNPQGFPDIYRYALVAKAASYICIMDASNPKAQSRLPHLENRYEEAAVALAQTVAARMSQDDARPIMLPALVRNAGRRSPGGSLTTASS